MARVNMPSIKAIVPLVILLAGCRNRSGPTTEASAPRKVRLDAGTPIPHVLFDELTSGGSAEVRLALMDSVQGLPVMSPITAIVS
ncbi:hypothetical protein EON81_05595 [bacterium]|nr:MAG: hypothetical protein EON81_05595 [bacterium]